MSIYDGVMLSQLSNFINTNKFSDYHYIKVHHLPYVPGIAVHKIKYTWQNNEFCLFSSIVLASEELIHTSALCCGFPTHWMKVLVSAIALSWYRLEE